MGGSESGVRGREREVIEAETAIVMYRFEGQSIEVEIIFMGVSSDSGVNSSWLFCGKQRGGALRSWIYTHHR
jgi:hypothetical protein